MADWELDSRRFAEEVFLAVDKGWSPENDWFRVYQLPLDTDDPELIRRALEAVRSHLSKSQLGGVHAGTAQNLARLHDRARQVLLDPVRREEHRRAVLAARGPLVVEVRAVARGMSAVPARVAEKIAKGFAGRFTVGDVRAVLDDLGCGVREPVELAVPPAPPGLAGLRDPLTTLGARSLGEYLRSPQRRLGVDPTERVLDDRLAAVRSQLAGDELTAEEKVLTALRRWRGDGKLADVLRRDCVETLTGEAVLGGEHLRAQLRRNDVRRYTEELGLPALDELEYALLCRALFPVETSTGWQADVDAALAAKDLRQALTLLAARPNLPLEYAVRRDELVTLVGEVDDGLQRARELEARDREAAAELYSAVLARCVEPAAEAGLQRCRPAPPQSPRAVFDGDVVRISWEASRARVGVITYAVVRHDGTPVGPGTPDLAVVDAHAPAGVALTYMVTTRRDDLSGDSATTPPLTVLRPVTDLALVPGDDVVEIHWTLPDGAVGARVTSAEEGAPAREIAANAGSGIRDTSVRTGTTYVYGVTARYRVAGEDAYAVPVTARVRPQRPPDPVRDLRAERDGEEVVLSWTPPPTGDVWVLVLTAEPREPVGRVLTGSAARRLGTPVRGRRDAGGLRISPPATGHRYWLAPLTVTDDLAVLGRAVPYDVRLHPVGDLAVTQQGPQVLVTWPWPPGATEARVYRKEGGPIVGPDDPDATAVRITHVDYQRRGCRLPTPIGPCWFGVGVLAVLDCEETAGPIEQRAFTGVREIRYEIRRVPGWGRSAQRVVELTANSGPLPGLQVRGRVDLPPLRPDEGQQLARLDAPEPTSTQLRGEFALPGGAGPWHLRAFAVDAPGVVLVPAQPAQLRIGGDRTTTPTRPLDRRQRRMRCPYCFDPIEPGALLRRCPDSCMDTGHTAEYVPSTATTCPHGDEPAYSRFCPHCRKRLEHDYVTTPSRIIATIGSSNSGKSTAIGVVIRELRDRVGEEFGGMTTELVGDASKDRYVNVFEKPLFLEGRVLAKTDSVRAARRLEPLLFMIRRRRPRTWWRHRQLLAGMNVFYDTAGEDVLRETSMGPLVSYLHAADAIVFVLDPLQVPSVRRAVGEAAILPDAAPNQVDILARAAELLRERRSLRAGERIDTPLAVVLTKIDALSDQLPPGGALTRPGPHDGVYDEADGGYVHDEVRAVLSGWTDGRRLLDVVDGAFADPRYFGMSALGSPTSREGLAAGGVHPLRVEDPMLWLLARFGLVPRRRAPR